MVTLKRYVNNRVVNQAQSAASREAAKLRADIEERRMVWCIIDFISHLKDLMGLAHRDKVRLYFHEEYDRRFPRARFVRRPCVNQA